MTEITRRSLLRTGVAAGAATLAGLRPWAPALAGAAVLAAPHLRRSDYAGQAGTSFAVTADTRSAALRLVSVSDVAGAAHRRELAGSEDAFVLTFSGPLAAPLDSGIHTLEHPSLGRFDLFVSPVSAPGADQRYEAVVDRSVGAPKSPPAAPPVKPAAPPAAAPAAVPSSAAAAAPRPRRVILLRRARLRRLGRGARAEIELRGAVAATRVRVRLVRRGRTVAAGIHAVQDRRATVRLASDHHLAAGAYVLVVSTVDAAGAVHTQRSRVTLR